MGHHWGHHRRWAPTKNGFASFRFRHADGGANRARVPGARDAAGAAAKPQTPPQAGFAAAGRGDTGKSGPVAALGAMVRSALTRLLAVDF